MDREKISVTIITHNEKDNIRDCLDSVKWADEIIVVDSDVYHPDKSIMEIYRNLLHKKGFYGRILRIYCGYGRGIFNVMEIYSVMGIVPER